MGALACWSTTATDPQNAGEAQAAILPRSRASTADGARPGAVYSHGATDKARWVAKHPAAWVAAGQGYPVLSRDFSGDHWGNDTAIARMDQAAAYMTGTFGAKVGKLVLVAHSMGGCHLLNWATRNPSQVAAVILSCPVLDLKNMHDANVSGYAASIETAYGGLAGYQAAATAHNPMDFAGTLAALPIRVYYSTNDPVCTPAQVSSFAGAAGSLCSSYSMSASGHTQEVVPPADVLSWMQAQGLA